MLLMLFKSAEAVPAAPGWLQRRYIAGDDPDGLDDYWMRYS